MTLMYVCILEVLLSNKVKDNELTFITEGLECLS